MSHVFVTLYLEVFLDQAEEILTEWRKNYGAGLFHKIHAMLPHLSSLVFFSPLTAPITKLMLSPNMMSEPSGISILSRSTVAHKITEKACFIEINYHTKTEKGMKLTCSAQYISSAVLGSKLVQHLSPTALYMWDFLPEAETDEVTDCDELY